MKWVEKSLDELGTVGRGRSRHRPRDAAHLYGGPFPFVQTGDVKHAGLYLRNFEQTYSEAGLGQSKLWPSGTLCITIAANIADTAILGIDACFPDSVIGFIADKTKADTRFIKYLFDALLKKKYQTFSQGVAQDNLSQEKLLSLKLTLPEDAGDQGRLANVLSTYDDLIANNDRRIELLERSVRLLFHEWFVRLQYPGHVHDKITGGIPEGWRKTTLTEVADTNKESYTARNLPSEINYVDISSVKSGRIHSKTKLQSDDAPGRARRIARNGDVIWSNVRPNLRQYALILNPEPLDVFSTGFTVLSTKSVPYSFLYIAATTDSFVGHLVNFTTGSSYPAVRPEDFECAELLVPSEGLLQEFHNICEPALSQCKALSDYNATLAQARDLLLPRLMDGRVSV